MHPGGLPHSEISGSSLDCSSPKRIVAYHVLHRPSAPRHPPRALCNLTNSFETLVSISHSTTLANPERSPGRKPASVFVHMRLCVTLEVFILLCFPVCSCQSAVCTAAVRKGSSLNDEKHLLRGLPYCLFALVATFRIPRICLPCQEQRLLLRATKPFTSLVGGG